MQRPTGWTCANDRARAARRGRSIGRCRHCCRSTGRTRSADRSCSTTCHRSCSTDRSCSAMRSSAAGIGGHGMALRSSARACSTAVWASWWQGSWQGAHARGDRRRRLADAVVHRPGSRRSRRGADRCWLTCYRADGALVAAESQRPGGHNDTGHEQEGRCCFRVRGGRDYARRMEHLRRPAQLAVALHVAIMRVDARQAHWTCWCVQGTHWFISSCFWCMPLPWRFGYGTSCCISLFKPAIMLAVCLHRLSTNWCCERPFRQRC